ncbi:MAG: hypothetical protein AB2A00_13135 [Myxococcota bacterium]
MVVCEKSLLVAVLAAVTSVGCAKPDACKPGQTAPALRSTRSPVAGQHIHAHAHNDYEHAHPLHDAVENRFYSAEADLWIIGGELRVGHWPWDTKGTLDALYLDPLQELVNRRGSVHGDGESFTLWLDLKDGGAELRKALHQMLERYSMLTVYNGDDVQRGPVTVVLTGDSASKAAFVKENNPRRACRDSNDYSPDDPASDGAWLYYALDWADWMTWDGVGEMPHQDRDQVACIVQNAHATGRKVRFYGAPDNERVWGAMLELGMDFINTDRLPELNGFLDVQP